MAITPVEVRHVQLKRGLFGYRRGPVDRLLEQIAGDFEQVWRERADLQDRVEELNAEIARHVELETLLRSTLVSAERAAQELKEQARREAEVVLAEAHGEARAVLRDAIADKERVLADVRRIRALLRSALDAVEEEPASAAANPPAAEEAEASAAHTPSGWQVQPVTPAEPDAPSGWQAHVVAAPEGSAGESPAEATGDGPGMARLAG